MEQVLGQSEKLHKGMKFTERLVFPLLLMLYPLLLIRQGIDVSDTTYSLGYYRFMGEMDITWVLATYLANVAGALLMKLPMGNTLLGMNFYTGLLAGAIALICYCALSRRMPAWIVFLGEIIALSLCWCPTTILYNYLTYFFFAAGCLLLYRALTGNRDRYFVLAGICLGLNVMVRFSNLAEAALIIVVWYTGWLKRDTLADTAKKTGLCLAGYLAGFGSILLVIMVKYGAGAFGSMIGSLFGMTGEASDYTLMGMVSAIASAYLVGFQWMAYMVPCILAGMVMFRFRRGWMEKGKKLLYFLGMLILLRFYWGRGMYSFRYYNEGCVFQWMMLFLILTAGCCVAEIFGLTGREWADRNGTSWNKRNQDKVDWNSGERILAAMVLVVLIITPLGSNNYTYQNMNNLFLAAPYTLWVCYRLWLRTGKQSIHYPWQAFLALILLMILVQGLGFGCRYVFRDGIYGEERRYEVENSPVLKHMRTTEENARSLQGLIAFCGENGVGEEPLLFWGDAPGLSYILDVPSAIFTTWPEIPSNTYDALSRALEGLDWTPDVILHNEPGREIVEGEKTDLILDYMAVHGYQCIYENECYKIYRQIEEG